MQSSVIVDRPTWTSWKRGARSDSQFKVPSVRPGIDLPRATLGGDERVDALWRLLFPAALAMRSSSAKDKCGAIARLGEACLGVASARSDVASWDIRVIETGW